jgi:hypothetical protein
MTEQLLDLPDVGATFQQVSRTRMSQRVRGDVLADAGAIGSFGDDAHDVIVIKWTTGTSRDKQPHLARFKSEQDASFFQIQLERSDG